MATTDEAMIAPTTQPQEKKRWSLRRIEITWGYLFILPWIIGFIIFTVGPMAASLYLSMTDYKSPLSDAPINWIGFKNYDRALGLEFKTLSTPDENSSQILDTGYAEMMRFDKIVIGAKDPDFWKTLKVTLSFAAISLPISLFAGLMIAVLLNNNIRGINIFRTLIYAPSIVPLVAAATVFQQMLGTKNGWINRGLQFLGIAGPDWLNNPSWMLLALTIIGLWGVGGGMIIYLAGLQGVPTELYEASRVDGANIFTQFYRITLPMISPVILYNLVLGLIGSFQYFTVAYVVNSGQSGVGDSAYFLNLYLYKTAFTFKDMGYAATLGWLLFIIVMIITLIVFRTSGGWVFYAGSRRN